MNLDFELKIRSLSMIDRGSSRGTRTTVNVCMTHKSKFLKSRTKTCHFQELNQGPLDLQSNAL